MEGRDPRPVHLPGAGTRIDLHDADGHPLAVIARLDGGCDVYLTGTRQAPARSVRLDPSAARSVAALLGGHILVPPELIERLDGVLGGLTLDWVRVARGSSLVGQTIAEARIRQRTGVTVVAVLRGSLAIASPDAGTVLGAGDELVLAGREVDIERFRDELEAGPHGP
jgi:TrkA domain protein